MSLPDANSDLVRGQLKTVLACSVFRDSDRHSRLLEFLVDSTLSGKAGELKEFVIAAEVWGRDISFDPRIHSTVRVEIGRLRARLERYYASDGAQDPLRFKIPVGGYAVAFEGADPAPSAPPAGDNHFEIVEALDRGGMGEIWKARDVRLNRLVALKFIPLELTQDPVEVERFAVEAKAAAAINHPNICTIYETGVFQGRPFLAMELLEGQTLRHLLHNGPIALDFFLNWTIQIADGVEAAHSSGIVHSDLKPANLFITGRDQAKVLDFGLARLRGLIPDSNGTSASSHDSGPNSVRGTLGYMSPEQTRGERLDNRSDLFALGAVFFEMLTGRPAFNEPTAEAVHRAILDKDPPPPSSLNPAVPPELDRIVLKALEKDRDLRYQNAGDLRADLRRLKRDTDSQRFNAAQAIIPAASNVEKARQKSPVRATPGYAAVAGLGVLVLAATGWWLWHRSHPIKLKGDDIVVLAEFANTTGDPVFDAALRQGLSAQLEQSPFLGLLSDARIAQTLQLMAQPKGARLTPDLARQVCQRTGSAATIEGSISNLGSQFVVGLRALNCKSGDVLAEVQQTADRKEMVLASLGQAAATLRRKLGESLPSVEKYDVTPENVTTGSLEALEAYGKGVQAQNGGDSVGAAAQYRRAVALDPDFAMAYGRLGVVLGGTAEAEENTRKAYSLRDRVSDREKLYLVSHYELNATGNLLEARRTLEMWAQTYPHDTDPAPNLFITYMGTGDYDQALKVAQALIQVSPGTPSNNASKLSTNLIFLNRFDEAKAVIANAVAHHFDRPVHHYYLYEIDFLLHDGAGMEQESAYVRNQPGWEGNMLELQSFSAYFAGQFAKARDVNEGITETARRTKAFDDAAGFMAEAALEEALAGNKAIAEKKALASLELSKGEDVAILAGPALALAGNAKDTTRAINDLNKRYPEGTNPQIAVAIMRACQMLGNGRSPDGAHRAVEALGATTPYEKNSAFFMIPVYLRGQAYLATGQNAEAKVEFQKILDHTGVTRNFVTGALAHLGMGRALAQAGEKDKARVELQNFLNIWKDADPDLPLMKEARASLSALSK